MTKFYFQGYIDDAVCDILYGDRFGDAVTKRDTAEVGHSISTIGNHQ